MRTLLKIGADPWLYAAVLAMVLVLSMMVEDQRNNIAKVTSMTAALCDYVPTMSAVAKIVDANKMATATEIAFDICSRVVPL